MKPRIIDGRIILRHHAFLLTFLTILLTSGAYIGYFTGHGPHGGLSANPMAIAGLVQAYPLMGLLAVALWLGSRSHDPSRYSKLAIAAHFVPCSALAVLWEPISNSVIAPMLPFTFLFHGGGILAEIIALRVGYGAPSHAGISHP